MIYLWILLALAIIGYPVILWIVYLEYGRITVGDLLLCMLVSTSGLFFGLCKLISMLSNHLAREGFFEIVIFEKESKEPVDLHDCGL